MEERTRNACGCAVAFALDVPKVENQEFRDALSQLAIQGLAAIEGYGQRCVQFLLSALHTAASTGAPAMHDALWMLQRLACKSEAAKAWILEARGAEILHSALLAAHADSKFGQEGAWLAYYLDNLRGLADLLCRSRSGGTADHVSVRVAVAWVVFELVKEERKETGSQPKAESASVLLILIEAMGHESTNAEGQWACVAALDAMVKCEPRLGSLFLERGGARLLIRALHTACAMGHDGEEFRRAVSFLLSSLADGSAPAANSLRNEGALQVLAEVCQMGTGRDIDAAMWALGSLGGTDTVLKTMAEHGQSKPWIVRGGIVALSECAWNATGDGEELSRLPTALSVMLQCMAQEEEWDRGWGSRWLTNATVALGSVLSSLAQHVPPGRLPDVDRGMEMLLKRLESTPALKPGASPSTSSASRVNDPGRRSGPRSGGGAGGGRSGWRASPGAGRGSPSRSGFGAAGGAGGPDGAIDGGDGNAEDMGEEDEEEEEVDTTVAAEKASESIGRVALASAEWRRALRSCGALEALAGWIRARTAPRRLQKYLFWAAAAIAGLPFVANELQHHIDHPVVVDAALCTIIDILDDDIDGEYALVGVEGCSDGDVPGVLRLVVEAMQRHAGIPEVQARGCHCIGLLAPLVPTALQAASSSSAAGSPQGATALAVLADAAPVVTKGARRFPRRRDVICGSSHALRMLLGLAPLHAAAKPNSLGGVFKELALKLQEEGAGDCAAEALDSWCASFRAEDILEDAAAALALASGVEPVLDRLSISNQGAPIREAGLKALFEVARSDLRLLGGGSIAVSQQVAELCARLAAEAPDPNDASFEHPGRVREVAALLVGLCGR